MGSKSIYLDYAATTPVRQEVFDKMKDFFLFSGRFGNAGSRSHRFGWEAEEAVELARQQVAGLLGADVREVVFTSGATEANNLALKGAAQQRADRGRHLVTVETEHKAVLDPMRALEDEGFQVTYLCPDRLGRVSLDQLEEALRPDTSLVSVMWVNNETGVIQPIPEMARLCRARGVLFHTDATQAIGKLRVRVDEAPVDLLSLSGHKIYGPKGVGALYVCRKPKVRLVPQQHGGGQERGVRSGTLAVPSIVGLGEACHLAGLEQETEGQRLLALKNQLLNGFLEIEAVQVNGDPAQSSPSILNVSFLDVEGESLMMAMENLAVSSGSACTSSSLAPSYVLRAMGVPDEAAHSSIRFSFGHWTTKEDLDTALLGVRKAVSQLRALSPLWEMRKANIDLSSVKWSTE